jgi:ribosomal protein L11 methyltransferase
MDWIEVRIHTSREAEEATANFLLEMGAEGTSTADPEVLTRTWKQRYGEIVDLDPADYPEEGIWVTGYFSEARFSEEQIHRLQEKVEGLADFGLDPGPASIVHRTVSEESWASAWKAYYKPTKVTSRLTVKPVWEDYEPESEDEQIIQLDPGMAFGTGTHPTTVLSLRLLEKYLNTGDRVIDVGCGSGILSAAAAKLGAGRVLALDLDPVAVENAEKNIGYNQVKDRVQVRQGDLLKGVTETANLVVANILAEIILLFTADVPRVLETGGTFLASGIISQKEAEVVDGMNRAGLKVVERIHDGDWVALAARKW